MSGQRRSGRSNRRASRSNKYHQQYLSFLRKWKSYVHSQQYQECERLCLDHIDRIDRSITFQIKQYAQRHGGAHLDYNDSRFYDIKNYRSKVRNLYAVLLHDYLKQHNDALEQYELCVEDDEFNASAHYNWAILYKNFYKDYESAEVHYRKAIELKPNHAAYHNNYGLLLEQQLKKYDSAKKQFGIALSLDDKNGRAHTNMANLLKKHYKDYETAKIHYEKAINLDPQNPTRHFNYALFLKHNLNDYTAAADEYEKAINLDHNYYQAHNEYKNFLLTESPFDRHKHNKYNISNTEKQEHCTRCIKYAIQLLWNKKAKDAKEIMQMALKCQPNNPFAKLVQEPYSSDVDMNSVYATSMDQREYQQIAEQKENELYTLFNKMDRFHRRLSTITSKLKQNQATNLMPQQSLDSDKTPTGAQHCTRDSVSMSSTNTANTMPQPLNMLSPFDVHSNRSTTSESNVVPIHSIPFPTIDNNCNNENHNNNNNANNDEELRSHHLFRQNSESNWNLGQLDNLTHEMGQEIARLNSGTGGAPNTRTGFSPSDDEDDDRVTFNHAALYGNPGSMGGSGSSGFGSFNSKYGKMQNKMMKPYGQNMYGDTTGNRAAYLDSKNAMKRNSLISVNSASDFNQKYMDIHKQTLFSAAKIIENIMNESRSENSNKHIDDEYKKKLDDVMHMIFATVRVWDYIDFEADFEAGRLTEHNVMNHNDLKKQNRDEESGLLTPVDAMYDTTQTLGATSMISQTSSAAMDARKTFLKRAANNPNVRKADRIVAKHLAQQFLTTHGDTPKSVLSASQLPFFSDEDETDEEEDDEYNNRNGQRNTFKHSKNKSNPTQQHINCEQRVKRWKQMGKLQQHLAQIGTWDFDVFYVVENAGNYAMPAIALTLFETKDLVRELKLNTTAICNFFHQISLEYKNNPYHNIAHGCDVLVNCGYFLDAKLMRNIRTIDKFACLVAGATHDVGHPGNNNGYEINKESDLAVTYNDISVLESYHIALAWQVMKRPGCNILSSLDNKQRKEFRKLFIDSILNTDMSHHAEQQKLLAELIDAVTISGVDLDHLDHNELDDDEDEDANDKAPSETPSIIDNIPPNSIYADPIKFAKVVIPLMVHTADLSNPSKDIALYGKWAEKVVEEFFNQAENEKKFGLPVSSFMDKEQTDLPTIQTGFVNHVIRPWFDLWGRLLRDKKQGPLFQKNVNANLKFMQNELDKLKKEKEKQSKEEVDDFSKMKRRFKEQPPQKPAPQANNNRKEGERNSISVVDMTFEDINRVAMKERQQRTEELKTRQKEYYHDMNQNMMNSSDMDEDNEYIHYDEDVEDDQGSPPAAAIPTPPVAGPQRKKKLLYTGSVDTTNANQHNDHNGYNNTKNRKTKKAKKQKLRKSRGGGGNSRELTSIPEVI